jgi:YT521-B-like domain-containing protein/RNA recognition motif-containing protein
MLNGKGYADPNSKFPRGPPRKPKQSGHAVWVGSIPSNTSITALKDHFSRGFTLEIESVFLISKSSCAFVNYSTEKASKAAAERFHNTHFEGGILTCRLRKPSIDNTITLDESDSNTAARSPSSPAPSGSSISGSMSARYSSRSEDSFQSECSAQELTAPASANQSIGGQIVRPCRGNRYFVMKSLTEQDLLLSVKYGIWTTQNHNENMLNEAYEVSQ